MQLGELNLLKPGIHEEKIGRQETRAFEKTSTYSEDYQFLKAAKELATFCGPGLKLLFYVLTFNMIEHINSWDEVVRVAGVKGGTKGFPVEESRRKCILGTLFS